MNQQNQSLKIWAGLITLYLVWGSTYLALHFLVESVPSLVASGIRNLLAGLVLFTFSFFSKNYVKPNRNFLITTSISGFLMLTMGNGFFTIAVKWVPSGFAALFSAIGPVMLVALLWIFEKEKPKNKVIIGAILGIVGVLILMSLKTLALKGYEQYYVWGIVFMFLAVLAWNVGVVFVKKREINHYSAAQIAGYQMSMGGFMTLVIAFFMNDFRNFHPLNLPLKAYLAFIYLLSFGSIIAFLVFSWLSKVAPPTLVATYTYVNPLVAMFLGWLLAGESLHPMMLLAGGIIITAVILITSVERKSTIEVDNESTRRLE
jgi:drug/metabolite transporter (DMT)-like permease